MSKRIVLAILAVFLTWSVLDFVIHGLILQSTYEATADLWRPKDEMKMGLMYLVGLISAVVFTCIYACFFRDKTIATGLGYGLLYGIAAGIGMGYGTYSVMPIPYHLALAWFLGMVVEVTLGGVILGLIFSRPCAAKGGHSAGDTDAEG